MWNALPWNVPHTQTLSIVTAGAVSAELQQLTAWVMKVTSMLLPVPPGSHEHGLSLTNWQVSKANWAAHKIVRTPSASFPHWPKSPSHFVNWQNPTPGPNHFLSFDKAWTAKVVGHLMVLEWRQIETNKERKRHHWVGRKFASMQLQRLMVKKGGSQCKALSTIC